MRNLLPLAGLVLVFCLAFFGEQGLMANHELRQEMSLLQDEIEGLRTENARLVEQVQAMHDDPVTLDRTIREEMFMVSSDRKETVFVFPEGEANGAGEAPQGDPAAASGMR